MDPQNHCGGLYGPTKSLWWPVWSHKITGVACMDPQNHCGGLCGPTKSLWWPVWTHKITVVACVYKAASLGCKSLLAESLFDINILIKDCINLVMHYKFEVLWGGECKTWKAFHINI